MSRLVSIIRNKHKVEFDKGKFDAWCVYLTPKGERRYAPRDAEYFERLQQLSEIYGHQHIYDDFVRVYDVTDSTINVEVLQLIAALSSAYANDAEEIEVWLTVIYAGMVAEENKVKAILRKRIKRLGIFQALMQKMAAEEAAKFSLGKRHYELDEVMKELGF